VTGGSTAAPIFKTIVSYLVPGEWWNQLMTLIILMI
jgi:hypothetical protein